LKIEIDSRLLEIKKQMTFECKERSKVLAVYAIESKASEIDFAMVNLKFPNFKYLLYKHSSSSQRMCSMYSNEMVNVRVWFETLYGVNLHDIVIKEGETSNLGELLQQ